MPSTPGRSSKEWSASALEKDRKAKAEAARQFALQTQVAALQALLREAEENEKKNNEQAALERQAAKDQEFLEVSLDQQDKFRALMADNIYTRVAQSLVEGKDEEYLRGIIENLTRDEDTTKLKAMLWEAIAGDDAEFSFQAAQKIMSRYKMPITDEDLMVIHTSLSCLNAEQGAEDILKTEVLEQASEKRKRMSMIDQDTSFTARSESITNSDIDVHLTDPLGEVITGEEFSPGAVIGRQNPTDIEAEAFSTPCKRTAEDDSMAPAPSENGSTAPKKRKTAHKSTGPSTSVRFQNYIESRLSIGDLKDSDFTCSMCDQIAVKPRVAANCHHLYCDDCNKQLKKGSKGTALYNVPCRHEGCESTVGPMSLVPVEVVAQLKQSFLSRTQEQFGN